MQESNSFCHCLTPTPCLEKKTIQFPSENHSVCSRVTNRFSKNNLISCFFIPIVWRYLIPISRQKEVHLLQFDSKIMDLEYSCEICDKILCSKDKLKKHIKDVHKLPKNSFFFCHYKRCPNGNKLFRDQDSFKTHCDEHELKKDSKDTDKDIDKKSFQCLECGKCVTTKYKLETHKISYHKEKTNEFKCDKCPKAFSLKATLTSHIKKCGIDEAPRETECKECGKNFAKWDNLQRHIKVVHSGEKKFKCETCAIDFKSKNQKNNHNRITHRPLTNVPVPVEFKCEECDVVFAFHETYEMHCEIFHSHSSRGYFCPICKELYKEKDDLVEHVVAMHGIQCQKCVHCEKSFNFTSELKNHIKKVHTCSNCLGAHDSLNENHQCGFCSEGQKVEKMENSNIEIDPQELVHQNAENDHKDKESNEANLAQPANSKSSELQKPVKGKSCEKYPAKNSKPSDDVIQQQKADSNDKTNKPKKTRRMKRSMIENSNEKVSKIAKLDTANADHVNDDK